MIMALFSGIVARWQLALGLAAALILSHTLAYCDGRSDGRNAAKAEQAALERKAIETARKADQTAAQAVKEGQDNVEAGNGRARDAASGGDDPLRDGFNSLRTEARPSPAAR
jgi:hypothetical protein